MKFINKLWNKYLDSKKRSREVMKITSSTGIGFICPKCRSSLSQIVYSKSLDPMYFCKKCGYEGMGQL